MKYIILAIVGLLWAIPAQSACHVAAANGTGNGVDWTHPCGFYKGGTCDPGLSSGPGALLRGDTYYLASGSYPFDPWKTRGNGAATITIKSPTASDHCTDNGWNGGTEFLGIVNFVDPLRLATDYWIVDGQDCPFTAYAPNPSNPRTVFNCGIQVKFTGNQNGDLLELGSSSPSTSSNDLIEHVELIGGGSNFGGNPNVAISCDEPIVGAIGSNNNTITHVYAHDQGGGGHGINGGGWIFDHDWVAYDRESRDSRCHAEDFAFKNPWSGTNTIRYSTIINPVGTAAIATPSLSGTSDELDMYGNVVLLDPNHIPLGDAGDGIFMHLGGTIKTVKFINNTILGFGRGSYTNCGINISNRTARIGTLTVQNNLWWHCPRTEVTGCDGCRLTWDHNSWFQTATNDTTPGVERGKSNPLSNVPGSFHLAVETASGVNESDLFTTDYYGVGYGTGSRTWSRGAAQFHGPNP
jgi:hypothetical protein